MQKRIVVPAVIAAVGVCVAIGCGGGGGGGGGGGLSTTGNTAVDATLPQLYTSLRSGTTTVDATITANTVNNPYAAPVNTTNVFRLGFAPNDGTVTSATVAITNSFVTTSGANIQTVVVNETATGFQYMALIANTSPLNFSVRPVPQGAANLNSASMNGQYFAILTVTQTGTVTRTFTNTSPSSMATLVNFGAVTPAPTPSASGTVSSSQDYLMQYNVSGTPPVARLVALIPGNSKFILTRTGGPALSQVDFSFGTITFAGVGYPTNGSDVVVPIAPDIVSGISQNAQMNVTGAVVGGFPTNTAVVTTSSYFLQGPFLGSPVALAPGSFTVASQLAGLTNVGDGSIEADQDITADGQQRELPTGTNVVRHTLDGRLATAQDMQTSLYLPAQTARTVTFWIFR